MQEIKEFNKIFVANWKLNGSFAFINAFLKDIKIFWKYPQEIIPKKYFGIISGIFKTACDSF